MNENKKNNTNEEIDLGDLFRLIKKLFDKIGHLFLQMIAFILRHAYILITLIIIGAVVGYFWQKSSPVPYKTEILVSTKFNSSEYLMKSIKEANYKLFTKDTSFIEEIGLDIESKVNLSLEVEPVIGINRFSEEQRVFIQKIEDVNYLDEEAMIEMFNRSFEVYKVTLYHQVGINSKEILNKIMNSIRQNEFYQKLNTIQLENNLEQIRQNKYLIAQIDTLIKNYNRKLVQKETFGSTYYSSENNIDFAEIFDRRNSLIYQINSIQAENEELKVFLNIIDRGNVSQVENTSVTRYKIILVPLLFVFLYIALFLFVNIIQKAKNINQ